MNGIIVKKADGSIQSINVIRYFKLNDFSYLIFSLNEIDDGGYVKLYISKVVNGVGMTISDDVEWNLVKDIIKDIIKRNKDGIVVGVNDLDEVGLTNITINDQKVFKLNASLLQLLSANKNVASKNFDESIIEDTEIKTNNAADEVVEQIIPDLPSFTGDSDIPEISKNAMELEKTVVNEIPQGIYYGEENKKIESNIAQNDDYKVLYELELKKNDELLQELSKYQNLINALKDALK